MKKKSVALCTCNGISYLEEQLDSILNQTESVDELVICDDRSKDGTLALLRGYQERYPRLISIYENTSTIGAVKNFERAISLSRGEYIFLADQDDVWEPTKVATMLAYFKAHPECLLLFTNANLIDAQGGAMAGSLWEQWGFDKAAQAQWSDQSFQIQALIQNQNKITGATVGFRAALKGDVLPMDLPYKVWHDCFLGLMAAKHDGLHFLDDRLLRYRVHGAQQVGLGETKVYPNPHSISYERYRERLQADFEAYMSYYDAKYSLQEAANPRLKGFFRGLLGKFWPFCI